MSQEQPYAIQQKEVQSPAAGEEQPHAPVDAGVQLLECSLEEKDLGHPGGHQGGHEPEICPC